MRRVFFRIMKVLLHCLEIGTLYKRRMQACEQQGYLDTQISKKKNYVWEVTEKLLKMSEY